MNKWTEPYSHDLSEILIKIFQKLFLVFFAVSQTLYQQFYFGIKKSEIEIDKTIPFFLNFQNFKIYA